MTAAAFVPMSLEELELTRLLEAFPADKFEGRFDPDAPPYISPAQVKTALRCLETYRRRYVKGEKTRPAAAMTWGSADHATHEVNFGQKITTHRDMTVADIELLFATKLDEQIEKDGGASEIEWERDTALTGSDLSKAVADVKDSGVKLASMYHRDVSPYVQPTFVEERFSILVPGIPVPIAGAIDLGAAVPVSPGSDERIERIIDRKTVGRKAISPEWKVQARMYQLAKPVDLEWHLSLKPGAKRKNPSVSAFELIEPPPPQAQTVALVQRTIALVTNMYETYGPDEPWPGTALGGFGDNCGYCGFKPTCAWWVWNG